MTLRLKVLTLVLVLLPAVHSARAQGFALGTFHSFKGLGLSAEIPSSKPKEYNSFSLFADLARVYTGDSPSPGVKFNMSHNIRIVDFKPRTADRISLFSGAGFSAGWVRDSGKDCYGLTGALSGTKARGGFPRKMIDCRNTTFFVEITHLHVLSVRGYDAALSRGDFSRALGARRALCAVSRLLVDGLPANMTFIDDVRGVVPDRYTILISISTPAGRSRFIIASTVLPEGASMSIRRLWVRRSNCSRLSLYL